MRKFMLLLLLIFSFFSLAAAPQAVVFDYGEVLAFHNSEIVSQFLCETFRLTRDEFNQAKHIKKNSGEADETFWVKFAYQRGIVLSENWQEIYKEVVRKSLGVDEEMYYLVEELKHKKIKVGLLSNIEKRWAKVVQDYGLFQPFDPCLLACDLGVEKPDPRAYQILLEKMSLNAGDIIFIDDRFENVEAARKCGIDAIVFESLEQIRKELQKRRLL